jgi:mono/diheme cytochrome c family protein
LSPRVRFAIFCAVAAATLGSAAAVWASASSDASASKAEYNIVEGKKDYRQFCGQCHALAAALAAGFGAQNKFGQDGGPSFDDLRVSASLSIIAITEQFGGHEVIVRKMSWTQIHDVSAYVQAAALKHPTVAKISDG